MAAEIAVEALMNRSLRSLSFIASCMAVLCISASMPLSAKTYGVIVSGLGGNEQYADSFKDWTAAYVEALGSLDKDDDLIISLDESATREDILDAIAYQSKQILQATAVETGSETNAPESNRSLSKEAVNFVLILAGHGTADGSTWRFNIKGPDVTTEDLISALNQVVSNQQLVVLATSASGATLDSLSQPGRVVVTATKSGGEVNAVRFPGYLAEALRGGVADYDRNEILTIAEAYRFAEAHTSEYYERENLLASEHPRLRGEGAADMAVALLGSLKDARDDPIVAALLDQRLDLEQDFLLLKSKKSDMPVDEYYTQLKDLLISIATLQQSIDDATGWSEKDADS
jgi:hypothetical protein